MGAPQLARMSAFCTSAFGLPVLHRYAYAYGQVNASRVRYSNSNTCCATGQIRSASTVPLRQDKGGGGDKNNRNEYNIRLLACDMDGTILDSNTRITEANIAAVERLLEEESGVMFIPATGKSRPGALKGMGRLGRLLQDRYPMGVPGVYSQGLVCYSTSGELIHSQTLAEDIALQVVELAHYYDLSLIAYSGDRILSAFKDRFTDLLPTYHEPAVLSEQDWGKLIAEKQYALNKFIFMANSERIDEVRPLIAKHLQYNKATLTQAQANMLEVLPPGCNKGDGLRRFLKHENIQPANSMCIGDAENDLEMFHLVHLPIAMNNALPAVKQAAKFTLAESNDQSGVAAAIHRFLL